MSKQQWNEFMTFAAKFAQTVDLDAEEYDYKLAFAKRLQETRTVYLAGDPNWFARLHKDLVSANLMDQYFMMRLVALGRASPDDLRRAIDVLWTDAVNVKDLDAFADTLRLFSPEKFTPGGLTMFASVLLLGRDPLSFPPYRARAVKNFLKLVGWSDKGANGSPSERYQLLLDALDEMLRLAPDYGIALRDRLDAQGLLWTVMNVDPDEQWTLNESAALRKWRGDKVPDPEEVAERGFGPRPAVEAAARLIIDAGLKGEPSPFWPGGCSWSDENALELIKRIDEDFDGGNNDSFMVKVKRQLAGAPVGVFVLAAEFMALHMLPLSNVRGETKLSKIEDLLQWSGSDAKIPEQIRAGLLSEGAFNGGIGFNVKTWRHFCWLARFVLEVCKCTSSEIQRALTSPQKFNELIESVPDEHLGIKYSLEYLAWPSYFEPIISRAHRERIQQAFSAIIGGTTGTSDREISNDLYSIREAQEKTSDGQSVDWYLEPYLSRWTKGGVTGQRAWLVRQNQGGIAMLDAWVDGQFVSTRAQHLGSPKPGATFDEVQAAVNAGYQHIDYSERKARAQEYFRFLSQMKPDDFVVTAAEGQLFLGVISGEAEYVDDETSRLRRTVDWEPTGISSEDLPAPLPRLLEEQGSVVDLTDALSIITPLYSSDLGLPAELEDSAPQPQPVVVPKLREATVELARKLYVERDDLQEIVRLLQTRQQIVFYGPPGTGKTFLAGKIARFLAGEEHGDHVKTVQFHPSYAYEDFFEGYRPAKTEGGNVGFVLEPGPLRRIAAEAAADGNRDKPYFLIIDEMNRGNLAKIFGELYFLLEYREQSINLQYNSEQTFVLPPNLFIIGTMNTSDRSIAMVDAAIRRRFAFVELHPQDGMIAGMLGRYLEGNNKPPLRADLLEALNAEIENTNRDLMIGPSYFMKAHAESDQGLADIWKYELLPLLEEQYFGRLNRDKVHEKFGLPAMLKKAQAKVGAIDLAPSSETVGLELDEHGDRTAPADANDSAV